MFYDIGQFSLWLLLTLVVGCFTGWLTWSERPRDGWFIGWRKWGAIAWLVGLVIAFFDLFPGRVGLWLELALLICVFYIAGCFIGGWLKGLVEPAKSPATKSAPPRTATVNLFAGNPASYPGVRPPAAPSSAGADDLTRIAGIGPLEQKFLNDIGVCRYAQIADWSPANAAWINHHLAGPGSAAIDGWIAGARPLAAMIGQSTKPVEASSAPAAMAARIADDPTSDSTRAAGAVSMTSADRLRAEDDAAAKAEAARREAIAKADADRQAAEAAAKAEAARKAAEAAAKAEADKQAAEAAAKAEVDRKAAETAAKAEADRKAAEAAAKAEADRQAAEAAAKAEAERHAAEAAAKAAAERQAAEAAASASATDAPSTAAASSHPGERPAGMDAGGGDDLKLIKGIGPKNEKTLNALGVHRFSQIADWSPANAEWVGHHMAFPGRIEREHWIPQAKLLAAGVDTAHSAGVKSGAITIDDSADAPLTEAETRELEAGMPEMMAPVEGEASHSGARPLGLTQARGGVPDDLKLIKGIGKQNEARLHGLGVWHFDQIAAWTHENVRWVGSYLAFPGRIDREEWIRQARELAAGRTTEFARRVEAGLVKTSVDDGSHGQGNVAKVDPHK